MSSWSARDGGPAVSGPRGWWTTLHTEDDDHVTAPSELMGDYDAEPCEAEFDGWLCTRTVGHDGQHIAGGLRAKDGRVKVHCMWPAS